MNTVSVQCQKPLLQCAERQAGTTAPWPRRALATLKEWHRRHRVRARLRAELVVMDIVRIEKDAGLPTGALRREASKPFWKA